MELPVRLRFRPFSGKRPCHVRKVRLQCALNAGLPQVPSGAARRTGQWAPRPCPERTPDKTIEFPVTPPRLHLLCGTASSLPPPGHFMRSPSVTACRMRSPSDFLPRASSASRLGMYFSVIELNIHHDNLRGNGMDTANMAVHPVRLRVRRDAFAGNACDNFLAYNKLYLFWNNLLLT